MQVFKLSFFNCSAGCIRFLSRLWVACFLLVAPCGKAFADFNVELDVVFKDSAFRCESLQVLVPDSGEICDTLAVFDTLAFNNRQRVSLFYTVPGASKNMISLTDSAGNTQVSKTFKISPNRTTFIVIVDSKQIRVFPKDYLYPRKEEGTKSYFFFLLIFFVAKMLITFVYIRTEKLSGQLMLTASGAFLLSAFIDWLLPFHYFWRFLLITLFEFSLIAVFARKHVNPVQAGLLSTVVNVVGAGIISFGYFFYSFW